MCTPDFKFISQNMWKKSSKNFPVVGSSAEIPFLGICGHQGAKNGTDMTKSSQIQDTCYVRVSTKSQGNDIIFEAINDENNFDPFLAVK